MKTILNMCKRFLILAFYIFLCSSFAQAQDSKHSFTADLYTGLYLTDEPAWQLEPSFSWNCYKLLGLRVGVEVTRQYNQPSHSTTIDGQLAELTDNERDIGWLILKPSVVIKSPIIWKSADNGYRLWMQAEPGISVACPFRNSLTYEIQEFHGAVSHTVDYRTFKNRNLKWCYWNVRVSANFAIDHLIIGCGYAISNFDYYACRRNVILPTGNKFYVPKKELSKNIFLSIGYAF